MRNRETKVEIPIKLQDSLGQTVSFSLTSPIGLLQESLGQRREKNCICNHELYGGRQHQEQQESLLQTQYSAKYGRLWLTHLFLKLLLRQAVNQVHTTKEAARGIIFGKFQLCSKQERKLLGKLRHVIQDPAMPHMVLISLLCDFLTVFHFFFMDRIEHSFASGSTAGHVLRESISLAVSLKQFSIKPGSVPSGFYSGNTYYDN